MRQKQASMILAGKRKRGLARVKMRKGSFASRFLAILLILLFLVPFSALGERDVVRIGYFNSDFYGYIGAEGDLRGYDVQLSKTIGMYGGFKAEMLGYDNVVEMEAALRAGEVDVLIDFLWTEKRSREFIFTEHMLLQEQISLYTFNEPDRPSVHDVSEIGDFRIGYTSGAGFLEYFMDYCAEWGIEPRLQDYPSESEMHAAMQRGEIEVCLTGSAVPTGCRVILSTALQSSYMMLRPENAALRDRIDSAISQLKADDPDYFSTLSHRYITSKTTELAPMTSQEKEFLVSHPELSIALVRGAEPFTVENGDGSLSGIIPDYYQALGEKLGVAFRFIVYDRTQDAIEDVANGKVDILGHYYGDIIIADRENLYNTLAYGSTECGRLVRSGNNEVKTAAVTNRTAYLLAEQLGPEVSLVSYPNVEAGYQALMNHEVDAMIGSMIGISWLINQHTMRGVNLSVLPEVTLGVRGAVSCENPTLLFALNKVIAVSRDDMEEAIIRNASNGKTDIRTLLEKLPVGYIIGAVAVLVAMVVFLILFIILLVRNNRTRVTLLNREMNVDGLTGASSRRYGTKLLNHKLRVFHSDGEETMIVMFDLDHFKEKNDTFGHEYGDYVLKKTVDVLRNTLRKTDAIIRWGGDEFVLLCSRNSDGDADHILQKVISAINSEDFLMEGKGEKSTISAGASFFYQGDRDIMAVLRRCDSALYQAKGNRNGYCIYKGA